MGVAWDAVAAVGAVGSLMAYLWRERNEFTKPAEFIFYGIIGLLSTLILNFVLFFALAVVLDEQFPLPDFLRTSIYIGVPAIAGAVAATNARSWQLGAVAGSLLVVILSIGTGAPARQVASAGVLAGLFGAMNGRFGAMSVEFYKLFRRKSAAK